MAQKSRPDPVNGNVVNADEYEGLALGSVADGVIGLPTDTAVAYADSTGRQVKVRAGKQSVIRGYSWWSDPTTDEIIANLPANTSGNPRIDRLVLRLDRTARTIRTVYLQGTAAVTPVAPALTQNTSLTSGLWDFPLARWNVANGYTTVAATDIVTEAWYRAPGGGATPLCTSTSRPFGAYLYPGLSVYETDTNTTRQWDSSTWQLIAYNPPFLSVIKPSDNASTTATAFQDDAHLFFTVPANSKWAVTSNIYYYADVSGDLRIGWSGPAGATFTWSLGGMDLTTTGPNGGVYHGINSLGSGGDVAGGAGAPSPPLVTRPSGLLAIGGTPGKFQLRWCQNTSTVNGVTTLKDSWILLTRVG